jgi:hypothetical protein
MGEAATPGYRVRWITTAEVVRYVYEEVPPLADDGPVPISRCRALALSRNPVAEPDDPALLIVQEGRRRVGYMGVVPTTMSVEGVAGKALWLSTVFVDAAHRGRRLMEVLVNELRGLDSVIFGSQLSSPALAAAKRTPWAGEFGVLQVPRLACSRKVLGRLAGTTGNADIAVRAVAPVLLRECGAPRFRGKRGASCFERSIETQIWILSHPWVVEGAERQPPTRDSYAFTETRPVHQHFLLEIRSLGASAHASVLLHRKSAEDPVVLRVIDVYAHAENVAACLASILNFGVSHQARFIEVDQDCIDAAGVDLSAEIEYDRRLYYYVDDRRRVESPSQFALTVGDGEHACI